jgi:hypothetical protein
LAETVSAAARLGFGATMFTAWLLRCCCAPAETGGSD